MEREAADILNIPKWFNDYLFRLAFIPSTGDTYVGTSQRDVHDTPYQYTCKTNSAGQLRRVQKYSVPLDFNKTESRSCNLVKDTISAKEMF